MSDTPYAGHDVSDLVSEGSFYQYVDYQVPEEWAYVCGVQIGRNVKVEARGSSASYALERLRSAIEVVVRGVSTELGVTPPS